LLVEDNPNDVELTLRAFEKTPGQRIVVGAMESRPSTISFRPALMPVAIPRAYAQVVLLDMKLPKLDGWEFCGECAPNERTKRFARS